MVRDSDTNVHYEAVGVLGNLVHSSPAIKKKARPPAPRPARSPARASLSVFTCLARATRSFSNCHCRVRARRKSRWSQSSCHVGTQQLPFDSVESHCQTQRTRSRIALRCCVDMRIFRRASQLRCGGGTDCSGQTPAKGQLSHLPSRTKSLSRSWRRHPHCTAEATDAASLLFSLCTCFARDVLWEHTPVKSGRRQSGPRSRARAHRNTACTVSSPQASSPAQHNTRGVASLSPPTPAPEPPNQPTGAWVPFLPTPLTPPFPPLAASPGARGGRPPARHRPAQLDVHREPEGGGAAAGPVCDDGGRAEAGERLQGTRAEQASERGAAAGAWRGMRYRSFAAVHEPRRPAISWICHSRAACSGGGTGAGPQHCSNVL